VIIGAANPSGKLPVTVPRHIGQIPFHYSQKHINFKKDYLFTEEGPLYPFGYGLSYTDFDFSDVTLSAETIARDGTLTATINPEKELKSFQKINLKPAESRRVSFEITPDMLAFTGADMTRRVEPGRFIVEIGASSQGGSQANFEVE